MAGICILTDSTAQFLAPKFPGQELVRSLPVSIRINDQVYAPNDAGLASRLPVSARGPRQPVILSPSSTDFEQAFRSLGRSFDEIIVLLFSEGMNDAVKKARLAASKSHTPATVHIVDSQSIDVGLGVLVQKAAELAHSGRPAALIKQDLLGYIPHVYTVFGIRGLSYLEQAGQLQPAQALVGEMLGMLPVLALEHGQLTAVHKARSGRNLVDILYEYINEITHLEHIALLQSAAYFTNEARSLKERIQSEHPRVRLSEHLLNPVTAALIGPASLGIVAVETDRRMR
jgi:DegV family protein with EDD domain